MENFNTSTDNSEELQQPIIDDGLEKVVQDFNEFRKRIVQSSSSDAVKFEDLVDLYISNGGDNLHSTSPTTQGQLEDTHEFDSILTPNQVESTHIHSRYGDRDIQESEMMIKKMAEDANQNGIAAFHIMNINSHVEEGSSSNGNMVTYIRSGDLSNADAAGAFLGGVFGDGSEAVFESVMRYLRRMNFWRHLSQNDDDDDIRTNGRKQVKRKYRG